jgi:diadenosine tetraphosphate (Ap4A) HIT family hydrolase
MNSVFRTDENQARYDAYRAAGNLERECVLCARESVHEFKHWRMIENIFPYDKIAKLHHMVIPRRHVTEPELSPEELEELQNIKGKYFHENYDFMIESAHRMKSIPQHFHLHLILVKD